MLCRTDSTYLHYVRVGASSPFIAQVGFVIICARTPVCEHANGISGDALGTVPRSFDRELLANALWTQHMVWRCEKL